MSRPQLAIQDMGARDIERPTGGRASRGAQPESLDARRWSAEPRAGLAREAHDVEAPEHVRSGPLARALERRRRRLQQPVAARVVAALAVERAGRELDQGLEKIVLGLVTALAD